jgi:hypothetical protein
MPPARSSATGAQGRRWRPVKRHWRSYGNDPRRDRTLRDILARMRHDGCGGLAGKAELLIGVEGASSRPVRKIVLFG